MLPTLGKDKFKQAYLGLLPCDGRYLLADEYNALFHLIGDQFGSRTEMNAHNEPPKFFYAIPTLESPLEGYTYYICVKGTFPQFE